MNLVFTAALLLAATRLPEGEGKKEFLRVCGTCHDADVVVGMVNTRDGWADLVKEMITRGGVASAAEKKRIVRYLHRNYPQRRATKRTY